MFYLYLIVALLTQVSAITDEDNTTEDEIPESYSNLTENSLWHLLINKCKKPTLECVEKNMYSYLEDTLEYPKDYNLTDFLKFRRNRFNYTLISNETLPNDEEEDDDEPRTVLEEMSRSLHDKSVKFLMTHDMEVQLPDVIFQETTLKVSPRALQDNGALIKIELIPKQYQMVQGRLFKKLSKYIIIKRDPTDQLRGKLFLTKIIKVEHLLAQFLRSLHNKTIFFQKNS